MAQWLTNPTYHEVAGLIPSLAQWVTSPNSRQDLFVHMSTKLNKDCLNNHQKTSHKQRTHP